MNNFTLRNNSETEPLSSRPTWSVVFLGVVLYAIVAVTIFGNLLVLVAVYKEKSLRTLFNYYIVNLAITDVAVAITAMSFYTLDNVLGYWPFGEFICGVWIFFDYGMTFASVFTLLVISVDRFWSVTWSLHYRNHHNKKKCLMFIVSVWVAMVVLWLPACITDRINNAIPRKCIWEPSLNRDFVIVIASVGHHGSFVILLFCYIKVFLFMRKRTKIVPKKTYKLRKNVDDFRETIAINEAWGTQSVALSCNNSTVKSPEHGEISAITAPQMPVYLCPGGNVSKRGVRISNGPRQTKEERIYSKEKKAFITLTYIIVGYMICWLPFHIVFDVSALNPDAVPEVIYTITFWMTYINSTINPFLYNFSSTDFQRAFKKLMHRR